MQRPEPSSEGSLAEETSRKFALTLEPDILLVSEPTRGIDIGAKTLVLEMLLRLNAERGMTIIMTSSELAELRSICDRIAIIYRGKVQELFGLAMAGGIDKGRQGN